MSDVAMPPPPLPPIPHAVEHRPRRFPVIWLIPLVAIAIGGWLAWDTLSKEGPTITMSFVDAEGLQAGQSQLRFKDIVLGTVKNIILADDNAHVTVTIDTTRQAERLLTDTTQFWVVKPRLFAGNISGLSTLLSGSYIGLMPGATPGKAQRNFVGKEEPPVQQANIPGHTFLVKAEKLGSISVGSPVFFRDLSVGTVLGWDIGDMVSNVTIHVFVQAPYDSYVHDETRFWDASGLAVKLGGSGVDVQLESLRALLLGGIAFDTPAGKTSAAVSTDNHVFPLFANQDAANAASYTRQIPLVSYFPGSIRGLATGAEVTVHGLAVGHVTDVQLQYDPKTGVTAAVQYDLQPERVIGVGKRAFKTPAEGVDALIKQGLRATLQSASLITGQQVVALDFVPNAPPATMEMSGSYFVLPTTEGGGIAGLQASVTDLLEKVNGIPFAQIGQNLDGILQAANTAANGPQMAQSLTQLSATLASVKNVAAHLDSGMSPALKQLPELTGQLQKTLANTNTLMQSLDHSYGDNTKFNRDLGRLLVQMNETMGSFRSLADLLSRHPEALIKGRPAGGVE